MSEPKAIVARDQVRLGATRCLQLALSGMAYRMFRSGITVAILALAVAFVAHMLSFGLLEHATELGAYRELSYSRRLGQEITRLSSPDATALVLGNLAQGDPVRLREYQRWSGATPDELANASRTARRLAQVAAFADELPVMARAVLVGDQSPDEMLDRLSDPGSWATFERQLQELGLRPPLGDVAAFRHLVTSERPQVLKLVRAIARGQGEANLRIERSFAGRPPRELLAHPPPGLGPALREAGYALDDARLAELARFAQASEDLKTVNRLLLGADAAAAVARETRTDLGKVSFDLVADYVDSARRARWLAEVLGAAGDPARLSAERLTELVEGYRREKQLDRAVGDRVPGEAAGVFGLSERNQWLIVLSFLVCVVGVANAMLMSVTERFTEIATMKCLGAMDRFVMLMFVFEATIQGAVGGLIGLVLGGLLAFVRALVDYGSLIGAAGTQAGSIALALLVSLSLGVILAAIAAVGPSFIASRLAPMEAMRVE